MNVLYVAAKLKLVNEMYFAILLDRASAGEKCLQFALVRLNVIGQQYCFVLVVWKDRCTDT